VLSVEDWAEIRRLRRAEQMSISEIARVRGIARNTVKAALRSDAPPKYERTPAGSIVDAVEPGIGELLKAYPTMPATVIAERIGWTRSIRVLSSRVAELPPAYAAGPGQSLRVGVATVRGHGPVTGIEAGFGAETLRRGGLLATVLEVVVELSRASPSTRPTPGGSTSSPAGWATAWFWPMGRSKTTRSRAHFVASSSAACPDTYTLQADDDALGVQPVGAVPEALAHSTHAMRIASGGGDLLHHHAALREAEP
jgi:hypothetical protein